MVSLRPTASPAAAPAAAPARRRLERLEPLAVPALTLVVTLGVVLRFWSTGPLWLDEAQTVQFAKLPLSDLHAALKTDGAPPLYYTLLHGWLSMLNSFGLDDPWAARTLSMLFSVAALPLAYVLGCRLGGSRRSGQVALVVFAANPWSVRYAGEARMYSLVVLLVLLAALAADRLRERPGPAPAVGLAVVTAALLYTHYWAMFLIATVGAVVLLRAWLRPEERRVARLQLGAMFAGGVVFLPWVPTLLYQSSHTGAPWASRPDLGAIAGLPNDWFGGDGPIGRTLGLLVVPLLLLAVFGSRSGSSLVLAARPSGAPARLTLVAVVTLFLALGVNYVTEGAFMARYTAVVVPLVLLVIAFGIRTLPPVASLGVLAALVVLGLVGSLTIARTPHSQAGAIADVLNAEAKAGDLILYCPDQLAPAVEARLTIPEVDRLTMPPQVNPAVVDWTDYEQRIAVLKPKTLVDGIVEFVHSRPNATVWFLSSGVYRTHVQLCGALYTRLVASLGLPGRVLTPSGRGLETATLERFPR